MNNRIFKSVFTLMTLVLIIVSCGTKIQNEGIQVPKEGLNITCYNVENLFDTIDGSNLDEEFLPNGKLAWNSERYYKKLKHIVQAVTLGTTKNPILLGLVEVENKSVLEDLIKTDRFSQTAYGIAHHESPDERGIDVALLYDKNVFSLESSESLRINIDSVPNFKTRDILYVKGKIGEDQVHVFVNHWPSRRAGIPISEPKRIAAAMVVRAKVDEILKENPKANIIIMGDLNDHPDDKSVLNYLKAKDTTDKTASLYNLFYNDQKEARGTHLFQGHWGVLDHMIVSSNLLNAKKGLHVLGKDAQIVKDDVLLYTQKDGSKKPSTTYGGDKYYGGYSDHLPVRIFLTTK